MPAFSFEALDAQGQTRKGLLEADTAKSARSMLRAQALVPLTVELVQTGQTAAGGGTSLGQRLFTRPVFSATTLAVWTRQLAGLVSSGLPLERALTALSDEADDERQSHLVAALRAEVKQQDSQNQDEKLLRTERYYGAVARSFQLATDIDNEKSKAKYENGVLTLTLPKKVALAGQRLSIE